jgi:hypothetical protein
MGVGPPKGAFRRFIVALSVCLSLTVVSLLGVSMFDIFVKQTIRRIFTKFGIAGVL